MEIGLHSWQLWLGILAVLTVVEILTVTWFALGFAVAAGGVLVLVLAGVALGAWILPVWAAFGVLFWYLLSLWFRKHRAEIVDVNDFDSLDSLPDGDRKGDATWTEPVISHDITSDAGRKPFPEWIGRTGSGGQDT